MMKTITLITFFALGSMTVSGAPMTIENCSGKKGYSSMNLSFATPLELESANESQFTLNYFEKLFPNDHGFSSFYTGTGRAAELSSDIKRVGLKNNQGKWVANLDVELNTLKGVLTYKDFLLQPVDPEAPPITHTINVSCR